MNTIFTKAEDMLNAQAIEVGATSIEVGVISAAQAVAVLENQTPPPGATKAGDLLNDERPNVQLPVDNRLLSQAAIVANEETTRLGDLSKLCRGTANAIASGASWETITDDFKPQFESIMGGRAEGKNPWLLLVEDGADIAAKNLPPPVEIVSGIVCEQSKLVICSGAKAFKTWLTIMMALCIAHGIPFLGRPTTRRRVLYVNLELKPSTFDRRVQAIAKGLGITVDRAWFHHLPLRGHMARLTLPQIIDRLIGILGQVQAGVVVIDPLFKLNIEGEENSTRDQTVFFLELDRLTTEAGCTAILNDHSGKGNQSEKDPLDVIRGSSAKGGDLDVAMVLRKHEVEGCFSVDMVHRELPPVPPFVLEWQYPLMKLRNELDASAMKKPKGGQARKHDPLKLLAAIKDTTAGKGISVSAWAEKAGIARQTLQSYLPGMRSKDWISISGEGSAARQYITGLGKEALSQWETEA